jgi:hypothetical protein
LAAEARLVNSVSTKLSSTIRMLVVIILHLCSYYYISIIHLNGVE